MTRSLGLSSALLLAALVACAAPKDAVSETPSDKTPQVHSDEPITASSLSARPPRGKTLIIQGDTRLKAGEHYLPALGDDGNRGVVLLEGLRGVTLDLTDVVLRGLPEESDCDDAIGCGIVLRNCESVRIIGGEVRGYRVALLIESSRDITIEGLEVTRGYAAQLSSTSAAPDPLDRLELANDGGAWLRNYGAGIFIKDSSRVSVRDCKVRESQNGIVAVGSGECSFVDNDCSYLSGWGIALDASEGNELLGNRCDFVARAVSQGRYDEDYGAAGFLLVNGSSSNSFVGNSAVRCSVGVLALGSEELELHGLRFARNDFSLPAWRSMRLVHCKDSWIVENDALGGSGGGIELVRSTRVVASGNRIEHVFGAGLALRQSDACVVHDNDLWDCDQALQITGGGSHCVSGNRFENNLQDLVLEDCSELAFADNDYPSSRPEVHARRVRGLGEADAMALENWTALADGEGHLPGGRADGVGFARGPVELPEVLDEARRWSAESGGRDARGSGANASELYLGEFTPWDPASGTPRPQATHGAGLFGNLAWDATWFSWSEANDPRGDLERWRAARYEPLMRARVSTWTDPWGGAEHVRRAVGGEHFGLFVTGEIYVTRAGTYLLGTLSDDGLRVVIDGEPVFEEWTWHPARRQTTSLELSVGRHTVEVEYFQIGGAAELALELDRAPEK